MGSRESTAQSRVSLGELWYLSSVYHGQHGAPWASVTQVGDGKCSLCFAEALFLP